MNEAWKRDFETRLRRVNWAEVEHAFGPATDLPDQLMKYIELRIPDVWHADLEFFYVYLTHQGTRYPATLAAVPFLAEMLENLPDKRPHLIDYLIVIALGYAGWHSTGYRPKEAAGAYMTAELKRDIYQSVEQLCFPIFLELAQDYDAQQLTLPDFPRLKRDETTQILALWALGWFPARAAEARPTLEGSSRPIARFALEMLANAELPAELVTNETDEGEYTEALQRIYG